jgi:multidrug-efflux transporter
MIVKSALPLSFIIGSRFFGLFIILPVISVYALELEGATEFLVGVLIGVYAISQIAFQVVFGYISDRLGRKNSMLAGLLVFIAGAAICAVATDIYTMILGRFIQGAGAIGAVATAFMSDMTKEEVRGHAMAMMGAFIGLSFTLSMILSPILSHRYGLSSLFYLSIAVTVVCIVLLYTAVGKEPKIAHSQAKTPALKLLANRNLLLMNVSNFMQKMLMSAAFIIIPIAVVRYFGMQKSDLSGIYAVATAFGFIAMGVGGAVGETRRITKQILIIGVSLFVASYGLFALSLGHKPLFYAGVIIFFIGFNLHEPILQSMASKFSKVSQKGAALGIFNSFGYMGNFIGGIGGGAVLNFYGLDALAAIVTALCVAWLVSLKWLDNPNIFKNIYLPSDTDADMAEVEKQKGVVECYKNAQNLVVKFNSNLTSEAEIKRFLGV